MALSLHIRRTAQAGQVPSVRRHLDFLYERLGGPAAGSGVNPFSEEDAKIDRWYIGDEFCANRLPTAARAASFVRRALGAGVALTLLTPMVTDDQIDRLVPVFECLDDPDLRAEVTVNDWGLLFFLKERYPGLSLALGRLLNKGFKDPRLGLPGTTAAGCESDRAFLDHATFDQPRFREKTTGLGVRRLERDLMPYADPVAFEDGPQAFSVYFPFGYVTTGRVCWPSTFAPGRGEDFMPRQACTRDCEGRSLSLSHPDAAFPIRQNGNTIFYLYPPDAVAALFRAADTKRLRLVYQGVAL